jgi:hypothetical protein
MISNTLSLEQAKQAKQLITLRTNHTLHRGRLLHSTIEEKPQTWRGSNLLDCLVLRGWLARA